MFYRLLLFVILYIFLSLVNCQTPDIVSKVYEFKESEGSIPGKIMFRLQTKHKNGHFELEEPNEWVTVEPNGDVKVKEPWDYEQLHEFEIGGLRFIDFSALFVQSNNITVEEHYIQIDVGDVNDELPYFVNKLPMKAKVKLDSTTGTTVYKLKARDLDKDSDLHYFLVRDYADGLFEVDERTGKVRTTRNIPFAFIEYTIYVIAYDFGGLINGTELQSTKLERLSIVPII